MLTNHHSRGVKVVRPVTPHDSPTYTVHQGVHKQTTHHSVLNRRRPSNDYSAIQPMANPRQDYVRVFCYLGPMIDYYTSIHMILRYQDSDEQ